MMGIGETWRGFAGRFQTAAGRGEDLSRFAELSRQRSRVDHEPCPISGHRRLLPRIQANGKATFRNSRKVAFPFANEPYAARLDSHRFAGVRVLDGLFRSIGVARINLDDFLGI